MSYVDLFIDSPRVIAKADPELVSWYEEMIVKIRADIRDARNADMVKFKEMFGSAKPTEIETPYVTLARNIEV